MGASFVRVFTGPAMPNGSTFEKVLTYMIPAFQECAEYGKKHGVIIGLQHHDDFLKTADQTIQVVRAVNSVSKAWSVSRSSRPVTRWLPPSI